MTRHIVEVHSYIQRMYYIQRTASSEPWSDLAQWFRKLETTNWDSLNIEKLPADGSSLPITQVTDDRRRWHLQGWVRYLANLYTSDYPNHFFAHAQIIQSRVV